MYPGKNLGGIGEAGAVVTNDDELARQVRLLSNHGQTERYIHSTAVGTNGRLDAIQAAVLDIKLKRLDEWNNCRRMVAKHYAARLDGTRVKAPAALPYGEHIYHVYLVQVEGPGRRPRPGTAEAERARRGDRSALSRAAAPSGSLPLPGTGSGQLPGDRAGGRAAAFAADVPAPDQ
jgi:dTDP-4-amino-4,6-dideoxygalactose transaminase